MTALLTLVIIGALLLAVAALRCRPRPLTGTMQQIDECKRCGTQRTLVADNTGKLLKRRYHYPTSDGFTVCRGTGRHDWVRR